MVKTSDSKSYDSVSNDLNQSSSLIAEFNLDLNDESKVININENSNKIFEIAEKKVFRFFF